MQNREVPLLATKQMTKKITMLTAYDYSLAQIEARAAIYQCVGGFRVQGYSALFLKRLRKN